MEFVINSYKGLQALLNENSKTDRLKAKIKFSDETETRTGLIIYGKSKYYKNAFNDISSTNLNEYTFAFDELDENYCAFARIEPLLFLKDNPEKYHIEYIQIEMEI